MADDKREQEACGLAECIGHPIHDAAIPEAIATTQYRLTGLVRKKGLKGKKLDVQFPQNALLIFHIF